MSRVEINVGGSQCAPVVLMGYRRPEHTRRVFGAIREAQPSVLFVIMDGPKAGEPGDTALVNETREIVRSVDWDCEVHRIYADTNMGLKSRISSGLDRVFEIVDSAIILEDDCLPSRSFFVFASQLLQRFEDDPRVGMIGGSQRVRRGFPGGYSYAFSRDVRIWGWATWARTWKAFRDSGDLEMSWTEQESEELASFFASGPRRRSMTSMMARSETLDTWALPFAVHCARRGYLNPVPAQNLVQNIGLGESSTHTTFENYVVDVRSSELGFPLVHPESVSYSYPVDELESRRDQIEFFRYPLRHPIDTLRRIFRFVLLKKVPKVTRESL